MVHGKENLRSAVETAKPIVHEAKQSYDEMIRQIQESEGWRNGLFSATCKRNCLKEASLPLIESFHASWTCPFLLR